MSTTWYVGRAAAREISAEDWDSLGITASDTIWNFYNTWTVDESVLSAAQITYLQGNSEFLTGQTGNRPSSYVGPSQASQAPLRPLNGRGAWQSGTQYSPGDVFTFGNGLYVVDTYHVSSGASPDLTKVTTLVQATWQAMSQSAFDSLGSKDPDTMYLITG